VFAHQLFTLIAFGGLCCFKLLLGLHNFLSHLPLKFILSAIADTDKKLMLQTASVAIIL
jgi:hypothetical protein